MMMKRLILCTLFLAGLLVATQPAAAQKAAPVAALPASSTNFISDDDGGTVQIVPADMAAPGPRKAHTAPVMKALQPVSVFLGSGWADKKVRSREAVLAGLTGHTHLVELQNRHATALSAAASVEDFTDLQGPVNDLTIQSRLVAMLENKTLPAPGSSVVFVVFLAPGTASTVGRHTGGVDYAAYHNLIHVEAGALRYVVVPFQENTDGQATAAALALVETVFNPSSH